MKDINYADAKLMDDMEYRHAQYSLLFSFLPSDTRDGKPNIELMLKLISFYRGWLAKLSSPMGWDFKQMLSLRNCTPVGLVPKRATKDTKRWFCNRTRFCPWCYARSRWLDFMGSVDFAKASLKGILPTTELTLSGISRMVRFDNDASFADIHNKAAEMLLADTDQLKPDVLGTWATTSVIPVSKKENDVNVYPGNFAVRSVTFVLRGVDHFVEFLVPSKEVSVMHAPLSMERDKLFGQIMGMTMFPRSLIQAPVELVVPLLQSYNSTIRTSSASGFLANASLQEIAQTHKPKPLQVV